MKLTVEQQIWLEQYPVFHHGLIKGQTHLPFAFTNDKERHQGLISEYLMFLVEKLDITAHVRYQALRDIRPRPCRSFGFAPAGRERSLMKLHGSEFLLFSSLKTS